MQVEVNGARLYFDVDGSGYVIDGPSAEVRPTLILLHGSPGNSDHTVFKPLFGQLTDVAQIVYLDMVGSGRSDDSPSGDFSLERMADDLAVFCQKLGIEKPIVLGNSAGGMVAATYGIRHPDLPGKLVLSSTQARLDPERCMAAFERLGGPEARDAARGALVESGDAAAYGHFSEVCLPLYNPTGHPAPAHTIFRTPCAVEFHRIGGTWTTMDFTDGLGTIRCRTLVMAGELDPITPIEDSEDIVANLDPSIVRFERFANAGHGVWIDNPDRAFAVLREFITSD